MAGVVTKIATGTASGVYELNFTGISGSYDDLLIIGSAKGSHTGDAAFDKTIMNMRFNGDSGANYFWLYQQAVDTSTKGSVQSSPTTLMQMNVVPTSYSSNTGWGQFRVFIPGYASAAAKRVSHLGGYGQGSHGSATTRGNHGWTGTAAITDIQFYLAWYNFVAGSTMTLYGITNA